jgi:hypothetical protein
MRREYIIFGAILAVLLIAYVVTRNWVTASKEKEESTRQAQATRGDLEKLRQEFNARFAQLSSLIDQRLDSLERHYREVVEPADTTSDTSKMAVGGTVVQVPGSLTVAETLTVVDTTTAPPETSEVELGQRQDTTTLEEEVDDTPTEVEVRIYNRYLKKRWSLPGDLTKYELDVAKAEIYDDLADAYGITSTEARAIVDKVYEYRKRGKKK